MGNVYFCGSGTISLASETCTFTGVHGLHWLVMADMFAAIDSCPCLWKSTLGKSWEPGLALGCCAHGSPYLNVRSGEILMNKNNRK